jgi:hypothetical protein
MIMQMATVEEAVRLPLAHDIPQIRTHELKGPASRRGHVIKEGDVKHLHRLDYGGMSLQRKASCY